jgi:beta-lactamase class C
MTIAKALAPIDEAIADGTLRRAAAVVLMGSALEGEKYWGDASDGQPVDADTLFPFASLTKPVVATAVLRLVERQALELDRSIGAAIPDAPLAVRKITIQQLLTHTAGFPETVPHFPQLEAKLAPLPDWIRAAIGASPAFPPGSRVLYSNAGFLVLGAMVEHISHAPLPSLLERDVLSPLGMSRSTLLPLSSPGARIAMVELPRSRSDPRTAIYNSPYFRRLGRADAGLFATARDIARLLECYRRQGAGVLGGELARSAVRSHTAGIPGRYGPWEWTSCDFGLGWEIRGTKSPHPTGARTSPETFGHTGGSGVLAFSDPRRGLTVVIHCCRDFSDGWAAQRPILSQIATRLVEMAT